MIGVVGLGRMGMSIARRLVQGGHKTIGFDLSAETVQNAKEFGVLGNTNLDELAKQSQVVWLMVPAGEIVDQTLEKLFPNLQPGTVIVDGGNSLFTDSIRRAEQCKAKGFEFLDCGTSAGVHGLENGFCLMIGGSKESFVKVEKYFKAIAAPGGYSLVGDVGAGNYVKTIHNGIEYALLQAYAEGFDLLKNNDRYPDLDLAQITDVWQHGSVIRSWLLDLAKNIFDKDQELKNIKPIVGGGQTGRWTLSEAKRQSVPMPLLEESLKLRDASSAGQGRYADKVIALLRNQFGGHSFEVEDENN